MKFFKTFFKLLKEQFSKKTIFRFPSKNLDRFLEKIIALLEYNLNSHFLHKRSLNWNIRKNLCYLACRLCWVSPYFFSKQNSKKLIIFALKRKRTFKILYVKRSDKYPLIGEIWIFTRKLCAASKDAGGYLSRLS